jgi:hypothetical protein
VERRAVRDFGEVRRGDLGGYIESEAQLCQYGHGWVLGTVDGDAEVCDLAVIADDAHVGGRTIVCGDEIVSAEAWRAVRKRRPAGSTTAASRLVRH